MLPPDLAGYRRRPATGDSGMPGARQWRMATKRKKTASARGKAGGRQATGIQKPVEPDEDLAAIVGAEARPRTEMTKRLWDYIKSEDLQDPKDRRVIRADAKLARVFDGKRRVSMLEIARYLNGHVQ